MGAGRSTGEAVTEEEAKRALLVRLAELGAEDRANADTRDPVALQQDAVGRLSRMDAMQVQAMALATERRRKAERSRIEAAIKRIESGEWGWCLACGEEIAEGRLRNDPSVAICLNCASGKS